MSTPERGELIVYRTEDGQPEVQLRTLDGSVWLNQGEMAKLFDTSKQNVSLHIKNILKALARVAWPQSLTSVTGVNQRRSKPSSSFFTTKAVSDKLFSAAIDCR